MTTMVRKRVDELEGPQLDWAVAKADGLPVSDLYLPSRTYTDWVYGGPIIERERMYLEWDGDGEWRAHTADHGCPSSSGHTPLIAAMRAFVASKLGDEVEVPV